MLKKFAHFVLKLFGWTLEVQMPIEKKFVLIGAPHTSNWDFPLALLVFWTLEPKVYWLAKMQIFRGPLYYLFTALGGIPIDRSSPHGLINKITDRFNQSEEMILTIAPEGTRSKTEYWKSGFYYIALSAKVPVCLGYIDYSVRKLGFKQIIYPTGNTDSDMKIIADFYKNFKGKRPQNQGPIRIKSN